MRKRSDRDSDFNSLRKKIIGLGERSFRKSHYPTLQDHLARLERFRALLDQSRDVIVLMEVPSGRVIDFSESASTYLGYSRDELLNKTVYDLWSVEVVEFVKRSPNEELGDVTTTTVECPMFTRQGTDIPVEVTLRYARFDDSVYAVAVARDISVRKQLEEQLRHVRKMEAIGTLAGGVAHDFNNLLQVILGYADMLLLDKDKEDLDSEGLNAIIWAARDGRDLVKGLLAFSRKVGIEPHPVDLNQELKRIRDVLYRTIPKMIDIELILDDKLKTIHADPSQMEQVLLNLTFNARDAMPEGGKLTIKTENVFLNEDNCKPYVDMEPGEHVILSVSDTGHGMNKEVLDHVFEPFYTTKEVGKGTGLGLATVFGIIKSHNGHITCESKPGFGTTFNIILPAMASKAESDIIDTAEPPAPGTETILLVDDDKRILNLGKEMLSLGGYKTITASDGQEALNVYRKHRDDISLVILDLIMPKMGGKECLSELLKIDPGVRVLIASGYAADGPSKAAVHEEAWGFISKPFDTNGMLRAVRSVLDKS